MACATKPRCQGRVMGSVGGGGNIAIETALPPSYFAYCNVNIITFIEFLNLTFYACLRLRFKDVETNPGPRGVLFMMLAEYSVVICGAKQGTLVT